MKRVVSIALIAVLAFGCVFALFLPLAEKVGRSDEYICVWEDGETTREKYAALYPCLDGITEAGNVRLMRGERYGEIEGSEALRAFLAVSEGADAAALFSLSADELEGLERAAVNLLLQDRLWYADGYFAWTGEGIAETEIKFCQRLVVLSGELPADALILSGAEELVLSSRVDALEALCTSHSVEQVALEEPYTEDGSAIYYEAAGVRRLVAAISGVTELIVEDVDFIDRGALLACDQLFFLDVPFVGSAANSMGANYDGMLAHLFSTGERYLIPKTLSFVRVRGGRLVSHAFYGCGNLQEIDACGVARENIASDAFVDCTSLRRLHTPRPNVALPAAGFTPSLLACGCTLYERA